MKYCPSCGTQLDDSAHFCRNCGFRLDAEAPGSTTVPAPTNPPQQAAYGQQTAYGQQAAYPTGWQQQSAYAPYAPTTGIREDRKLGSLVLLSLITGGIYEYYYIWKISKDANLVCAGDGQKTPGLAAFILLSLVTAGIYNIYWMSKLANRLAANAGRYQVMTEYSGNDVTHWFIGNIVCIVLAVLFISYAPLLALLFVVVAVICSLAALNIIIMMMNQLASAYNRTYGLTAA